MRVSGIGTALHNTGGSTVTSVQEGMRRGSARFSHVTAHPSHNLSRATQTAVCTESDRQSAGILVASL